MIYALIAYALIALVLCIHIFGCLRSQGFKHAVAAYFFNLLVAIFWGPFCLVWGVASLWGAVNDEKLSLFSKDLGVFENMDADISAAIGTSVDGCEMPTPTRQKRGHPPCTCMGTGRCNNCG